VRTTDYNELKAYQSRYINPNQPVKRKNPEWLTNERKLALLQIFRDFPNNCLFGHLNCTIPEHYAHVTESLYSIGIEHYQPIDNDDIKTEHDSNGNVVLKDWNKYKTNADGNTLYIKVCESVPVSQPRIELKAKHELLIDNAVKSWSEDNRIALLEQWHQERKALHVLNEKSFPIHGRFNNISSVIFHENQPIYYIHSIGMSAVTMLPFVNVRLASSNDTIMVNLDNDDFKEMSKNAKHKVQRYNKPMPTLNRQNVELKVKQAVKSYLGY
jgi:hypothetical protein